MRVLFGHLHDCKNAIKERITDRVIFTPLCDPEKLESMAAYLPIESELFKISKKITSVSSTVASELKKYEALYSLAV